MCINAHHGKILTQTPFRSTNYPTFYKAMDAFFSWNRMIFIHNYIHPLSFAAPLKSFLQELFKMGVMRHFLFTAFAFLYASLCLNIISTFRYGVHSGRRLFCEPGASQSASGILVLLSTEVSEPRPQVPPAEAPGLLHLLHPQPGERGGHRSVSAAEPRL